MKLEKILISIYKLFIGRFIYSLFCKSAKSIGKSRIEKYNWKIFESMRWRIKKKFSWLIVSREIKRTASSATQLQLNVTIVSWNSDHLSTMENVVRRGNLARR